MIKDKETKIILFCINCNKESPHTVYYVGNYLRRVVCDNCNKKIEIDRRHLRTVFAEDFIDRVLTKPRRMTDDIRKAFATLLPFFPKRLFEEPLEVFKEMYEVLKKEDGEGSKKSDKSNKKSSSCEKNSVKSNNDSNMKENIKGKSKSSSKSKNIDG
ncbi:MAG: hypothetical protein PHG41_02790 [Actinomycetota bacterium]|nr:hypothetical protein [Actinomycetota bacterium]